MAELAERRGVKERDCELNHTVPYGTGPFLDKVPGNNLPGYDHLIPTTGQQTINTSPHFRFHVTRSAIVLVLVLDGMAFGSAQQ
jgi:hypothetical protein